MFHSNLCRTIIATFFLLELTLAKLESITTVKVTNGQSLCDISREVESNTKIDIIFEANVIELLSPVVFRNLSGISIMCSNCTNKRLVCQNGVGLRFEFIEELHIQNLNIENCSGHHKMNGLGTDIFAGVSVSECSNVRIENVNISSSRGTGMVMHNCNAAVMITNSHFFKNGVDKGYYGGTGLYIIFTRLSYVGRDTTAEHRHPSDHNSNSTYLIQDCTFRDNVVQVYKSFSRYSRVPGYLRPGRGGGLCLYLTGNSSNNIMNITESQFVNNEAYWGLGMYVRFQNNSFNNQLFVTNSTFSQNKCKRKTHCWGGGMYVSFLILEKYTNNFNNNVVTFIDCKIENNAASIGGGTTIQLSASKLSTLNNTVHFTKCMWSQNEAQFGSALHITTFNTYYSGSLPQPVFKDCSFTSNRAVDDCTRNNLPVTCRVGQGTVLVTGFKIHFQNTINISYNNGSGMILESSIVQFESHTNATFQNNTGLYGGAMSLLGNSAIHVKSNTTLNFLDNMSVTEGGAISYNLVYFDSVMTSQECFMQYTKNPDETNLKPHVLFSGNMAGNGENRITGFTDVDTLFAYTFKKCLRNCPEECNITNIELLQRLFCCLGVNASIQTKHKQHQHSLGTCIGNLSVNHSLKPIPGREVDIPINATDDFNQPVIGIYHVSTNNSDIVIDETSSYISDNKIRLYGKPGSKALLILNKPICRSLRAKIDVELTQCPPGYVSVPVSQKNPELISCTCGSSTNKSYEGIVGCDKNNQALARHGYWVGYHENRKATEINLVTAVCPQGFCWNDNGSRLYPLPTVPDRDKLDEVVCGPNNRTGIVCGRCTNNHSVFYHSRDFKCGSNDLCHLGWLFYILSELLPTTIFFVIILTLDISFTSGIANGFIFFAQVIDSFQTRASGLIVYTDTHLNTGYKIVTSVYRMFNLDFFTSESMSFCLWKGANALDMIAFKYITVVFAFLLVAGTILFLNKAHCFARFIKPRTLRSSIIHGLSAFLVVCYAQSTRASLTLIIPAHLKYRNDTKESIFGPHTYVFRGDMRYFNSEHLKYAIPALLCLCTVVLIPPLLLIAYPAFYKVLAFCNLSENKCVTKVTRLLLLEKMKPILDSFQSCYKDNCRYFAGLYFCYRMILLIIYAFKPSHKFFYSLLGCKLLLVLMFHCIAQPYKNKWHNIIDTLIFTNLSLINAMTIVAYFNSSLQETAQNQIVLNQIGALQVLLISLPLICMTLYLLYRISATVRQYYHKKKAHQSESENDLDEFPARMLEENESSEVKYRPLQEAQKHKIS